MEEDALPTTFVGSDGSYYTASEVCQKLAEDRWRPCLRDTDTGRELVEDERGDLLMLVPTDETDFAESVSDRPDPDRP